MQVEWVQIDRIRPYANNPRRNDQAVDAVAGSLREFGWQQPLVVDEKYELIVGETRWKAARQLGMKQVPVLVAGGLTPAQVRAYRLADNKTHEFSDWDQKRLVKELIELEKISFDFNPVGFSAEELQTLLKSEPRNLADAETVPEPPKEPITRPGDLWLLGPHRLLCGDPGNSQEVDRLVDGAAIHLANVDLSNGSEPRKVGAEGLLSFPPKWRRAKSLADEFVSDLESDRLLMAWFANLGRVLLPGRAFYCWGQTGKIADYLIALCQAGLHFCQPIIWLNEHAVSTGKDFRAGHELCCYGWKEGANHVFFGPKSVADVWTVGDSASRAQGTEKPLELAVLALQYSSRVGENVLDPRGGSGWTLMAAERTGRRAYLMEIDPLGCDVIVRRWEEFAGQKAVREVSHAG